MRIFRSNEIRNEKIEISKDDARNFLSNTFSESKYLDRFNLESLMNIFSIPEVSVSPQSSDMSPGIKIGYGFKYCLKEPYIENNVTKNVLEIPILMEFLSRGCEIKFIGGSKNKFEKFHDNLEDFSGEWKKFPKPYQPIPKWIEDCVFNYEKYGVELPDVDFVIMNAFPSFFMQNMMFYLINIHYARRGIPVFLWDIEFRTLKAKDSETFNKPFKFSGADKIFSSSEFDEIARNSYWLEQIPGPSLDRARSLNPKIRILPFFPPYWLRDDIGMFRVSKKPLHRIIYIGNDSERRKTIKKFFTNLSERNHMVLFGGGMSQRSGGYENFDDYIGTMKMKGPIPQSEVWRIYNSSRTCLSVARQRYYDVGFIVHRWLEVVLGGSILLLPRELYGVDRYMNDNFLVEDLGELESKIDLFNDKVGISSVLKANMIQKKFIYRNFSSERNVDLILKIIGR